MDPLQDDVGFAVPGFHSTLGGPGVRAAGTPRILQQSTICLGMDAILGHYAQERVVFDLNR